MQSLASSSVGSRAPALSGAPRGLVRANALSGDKLKRPELKRPEQPKKLFDDAAPASDAAAAAAPPASAAAAAPVAPAAVAAPLNGSAVTIEYQRQRAKEMRKYFEDARMEQLTKKSQVFGWTPSNEIGNGRWVMFGFIVGMLTEYATGVDFIHQLEQIVTYTGLWDFE